MSNDRFQSQPSCGLTYNEITSLSVSISILVSSSKYLSVVLNTYNGFQ